MLPHTIADTPIAKSPPAFERGSRSNASHLSRIDADVKWSTPSSQRPSLRNRRAAPEVDFATRGSSEDRPTRRISKDAPPDERRDPEDVLYSALAEELQRLQAAHRQGRQDLAAQIKMIEQNNVRTWDALDELESRVLDQENAIRARS
ncbi:MAG: hypothetical protein RIC55_21390 [Pirellulaceae bacterium]